MPETNRIEYKQDIFGDSFTRMIFRFEDDIKSSVKILNLIKEDNNNMKGFSRRNLFYMKNFIIFTNPRNPCNSMI